MASSASPPMQSAIFDAWPWWWDGKITALITFSLMVATILSLYKSRRESGNLPPGPRGLPLLGYLPFLRPELHRCFSDLSHTYGPVLSLHLGAKLCVVLTSPAAAREVLKDHDATFSNRDPPAAALALTYGGRDIAWAPNGPRWRALRKVCVRELLNPRSIDATYSLRRREVRRTAAELHRGGGTEVEVREVVFVTSLNVMTGMLWGTTAPTENRERIGVEFREVMDGMMELLGMMNVSDLFPGIGWLDLQGVERRMRGFAVRFDAILSRIIDGRLRIDKSSGGGGGGEQSKDFLEAMLEVLERGEGEEEEELTTKDIKAVLMDLITAGTDTTSTTAEWAMAELLHKPEIMRKLVEELDAVAGDEAVIEESHLPELQYLDAVVRETFRLHPATPMLIPHCPSATCTVGGYTIPKGTRVFINAWAIHRDPNFWNDPLEFRPERFLTGADNRDYNGGNGFSFLTFGSGRRICLGISLAERMLKYVLATLLHSFEWRSPEVGGGIELSEKFGIVLKKAKPLVAIPTPRFSNMKLYE